MMFQISLAMVGFIGLCLAEITSNGPLVYPSWPPKSSSPKPHHQLHQHIQNSNQRHSMVYSMRPSSAAASRYSSTAVLQSPSNMVYTQSKQRPYQQSSHIMFMQPQSQPQHQHNRIVLRPSSSKMSSSSSGSSTSNVVSPAALQFMLAALKPTSHHTQHHISSTATHPIFFKKPQMTPVVMKNSFHTTSGAHKSSSSSSSSSNNGGEYVFENPFASSLPTPAALTGSFSVPQKHVLGTASTSTSLIGNHHQPALMSQPQGAHKYSPIHTINAPNLSLHDQKPFAEFINGPIETNYIFEKDRSNPTYPQHIAFTSPRPTYIHQYQVTEPSIDFTLTGGMTAKQSLYATDADVSLPSYQIKSTSDSSFNNNRPSFTHHFGQPQPAASALIQQQIFPASLNNNVRQQPQVYHTQSQPKLPMSMIYEQHAEMQPVYNPTYLVTQSNQLLNQHKQHLFKPDPVYLQQQQQQSQHVSVRPDNNEFLPSYQLQPTNNVNNELNEPNFNNQNQIIHQHPQTPQSLNEPQFARLIAAGPLQTHQHQHQHSIIHHPYASEIAQQQQQQRPSLTAKEVSNLLNFGRLDSNPNPSDDTSTTKSKNTKQQTGFVASNFFQSGPKDSSTGSSLYSKPSLDDVLVYKHQQHNEQRIVEATREAQQFKNKKTNADKPTIFVTKSPEQKKHDAIESAHQQHQQKHTNQQQQRGAEQHSDLRIYVPDNQEQSDTFQKRSDDDYNADDTEQQRNHQNSENTTDDTPLESQTPTFDTVTESMSSNTEVPTAPAVTSDFTENDTNQP